MTTLPTLKVTTADPTTLAVDALVVPVFKGGIEAPGAEAVLRALGLDGVPRDADFRGRVGDTLRLAAPGMACGQVLLVGLGRMDALDAEAVRRAAGAATRALLEHVTTIATTLPLVHPVPATVRAAGEGALLGAYRFDDMKSEAAPRRLRSVTLVVPSTIEGAARDAARRATIHAEAQALAADLANTPASSSGPDDLADAARDACGATCEVEVWDEQRLEAEKCGGILAVGQGSVRPPRLVAIRYRPPDPVGSVAIVGKGIVFDTGGISLKRPYNFMHGMQGDMAGSAAVIAVCGALAALDVRVEVLGVCCIAENMPSGSAQRPGDIIRIRNGKTVEVRDTDAEGRLVLADGLSYATEHGVDAIVDLATLTGSVMHAVGARATGVFGTDDELIRQILGAAADAGEATWHLPMWEDLRENLDTEVADLNNTGDGDRGGATIGALFLREFVDDTPWVHMDIAGPAWTTKARHHLPKGGTGIAVRTLLRWLEQSSAA